MTVRLLNAGERFEAGRISMICFHNRLEGDVEEKKKQCEAETCEDWGAFSEDNKLMAHIINNSFSARFDGHIVQMGGIGAVSTLPEYRNTGAVRKIFEALLPAAYEKGEVFSSLYPFSHEFYRKFGYDTVCYVNCYEFTPDSLKKYSFDGEAVQYQPGSEVHEYADIYNRYASDYNLSAVRDDKSMKEHMEGEYFRNRRFAYLLRRNNIGIAYLIFSDKKEGEGFMIDIEDMAYNGNEGFNAILGFLGRFSADYAKIRMKLPYDTDLHLIIRTADAYSVSKRTYFNFMCRIINVQKALELMKKPDGAEFTVAVNDPYITENNGTWRVNAAGVDRCDDEPQMTVSIPTLSQLVSGAITLKEAMLKNDIEISNNRETFETVFAGKPVCIAEDF